MTNAHILYSEFGQSIWLNYFDRNLLVNGGFDGLILDGIRGANNNAEIFFNVFTSSNGYDETIRDFVEDDASIDGETLYQWLITKDTRVAADKLRAVYDSSKGDDGFVSVDIPAHVAYDTDKTLQTARHMWQRINRDNVMIKVPATKQGIAAITPLIAEGININVSCVYSLETYKAVVKAYLRGLGLNPDPSAVRSVASFGLSSFDAVVNDSLEEIGIAEVNVLKGKAAIAGARMAYQHYKQQLASDDFESQHRRGAKMQKLLWSDTRAHDPEYPELYALAKLP